MTDEEKEKFFNEDFQQTEIEILEAFSSSRYLAINKALLRKSGPNATIFISNLIDQFLFFKDKNMLDPKGCFFHTNERQRKETGMTEAVIRKQKKKFRSLDIIQTKMAGLPIKEWYKISASKLKEFIENKEKKENNPSEPQENPSLPKPIGLIPPKPIGLNNEPKDIMNLKERIVSKDTIIGSPLEKPISVNPETSLRKEKQNIPPHSSPKDIYPSKEKIPHAGTANGNSSPKKEWIIPGDWKHLALDTWNSLPKEIPSHNFKPSQHKDLSTKTICRASKYMEYLVKGTFFDQCSMDKDFMRKNGIPISWGMDGEQFSPRQILNAIRNFALYFDSAYWPANKKSLPRSLDTFIYNPPSRWSKNGEIHEKGGTSFLLRCIANPNVEPMKVCVDNNPQYTKYFRKHDLLRFFPEEQWPEKVYRGIQFIEDWVVKNRVFLFSNGSTSSMLSQVIGTGGGHLEPMFERYADWLRHEYNRLEPERMFIPWGYFREFLEHLANEYCRQFEVRL